MAPIMGHTMHYRRMIITLRPGYSIPPLLEILYSIPPLLEKIT
uniref:Ribosomal protein L23 n=1 Tax=Isolepis setacea TaxID=76460 RepID=A0A889Q2G4_9POAL|nr:ribosomal protein L23 [Isolepis setacea]YP_010121442.1 ribosomal protein L23 [Isolepis setacea]QRE78415.1 ribosomal protein L23 [Isolepis setacea]QRE78439.1 ribosomal protein L23 [Isolepis setacea]ULQ66412.1 ribosomal protein L23 [Isolepis setacea]ULQ66435.1 ribosomal protein L23 [Isolepis setacea]